MPMETLVVIFSEKGAMPRVVKIQKGENFENQIMEI